jgi:hypothetical protein
MEVIKLFIVILALSMMLHDYMTAANQPLDRKLFPNG